MKDKNIIRKKLHGNPKFNPFNKDFCWEELNLFLEQQNEKSKDDFYSAEIALTTLCYNSYYNEIMNYIKNKIHNLNVGNISIVQTLFALANREFYLLNKNLLNERYVTSIKEIASLEVNSPIDHFGTMNVVGTIETQVEIVNILVNILRHDINDIKSDLILQNNYLTEIVRIYGAANLLYLTKESYDTALWDNGYIILDGNRYFIKYINPEYPIARRIGDIRVQNNVLGAINVLETLTKTNKQFNYAFFEKNRADQILDKVWKDSNESIQYLLKKGENCIENDRAYAMARTEIDLYYPFITNKKFTSICNLEINDLLIMFSKLSGLIEKINENLVLSNENDTCLNSFSIKVSRKVIVRFLKGTTIYTKNQIESFIELIESKYDSNSRINFWSKPVWKFDDFYYFMLSNIISPNYSFLVDEWLHTIGYDLKVRGTDFERYIKVELRKALLKRKFEGLIPDKNKYYIDERQYEEIDLIVNLKNVVIIGEVKCIKYPMDSRDSYNNLKILRKAAEQIIRKTDYIYDNRNCFHDDFGNIESKKIIKVIITNYPIYAGTNVEGIPVIDYYLFDSYFRSGKLTHSLVIPLNESSKEKIISETINYYTNEDEFCANLEGFINNPVSIKEIRDDLSLETRELTLPNASIKIFQDFVKDKKRY